MAILIDWTNKIVESTSSITDIVAFHQSLRDQEDSEIGILYPVTHLWKTISLGGGAYFYAVEFTNGWKLKFPLPGNYEIIGNIAAEIIETPGVFIERKTSAAFATTSVGGSGPSAVDIADEVWKKLIAGNQVPGSAGSLLQDISARIIAAS